MQCICAEYETYSFQELSSQAQERVREWYLDGQDSDVFEDMVETDMAYLFPNSTIYVEYSLGACQGDGLNLYGDITVSDILKLIQENSAGNLFEDLKNNFSAKEIRTLKAYSQEGCIVKIPRNPSRYTYCYAPWTKPCEDWDEYLSCWKNINWKLINRFESVVKKVFTRLCNQWESAGYEFFYEINDEDLNEICESNDYRFLEDGSYFYVAKGKVI